MTRAKFMLPLRLGTVNANGPQDLIIYALTKNGRVETSNYRTVKLPSDIDVPLYVKDEFGNFYKAMFDRAVERENMHAVFVEYAWDMGWCDPCAADPLTNKELVELGARWIGSDGDMPFRGRGRRAPTPIVTRLHVRYDAKSFPEDLVFIETKDRSNFQGRYILRHPWTGKTDLRRRPRNIARRCRRASARRPRTSPSSPAGSPPRSRREWRRPASPLPNSSDRTFAAIECDQRRHRHLPPPGRVATTIMSTGTTRAPNPATAILAALLLQARSGLIRVSGRAGLISAVRQAEGRLVVDADILIIGGGSAGCVLAARLSEDPTRRVILIEAGKDLRASAVPADIANPYPGRAFLNPSYLWNDLKAFMCATTGNEPGSRPAPKIRAGANSRRRIRHQRHGGKSRRSLGLR